MTFISEDFLLETKTAKTLYHEVAASLPIFDWHCHLIPQQIAQDHRFENITRVWLGGDHYKWRLMRLYGIDEKYITHEASDYEKFKAYCEVMPHCLGNPVYHWSHLELKRFFGIEDEINPQNCDLLWEKCNQMLQEPSFSARNLMVKSNVKYVCTSDDPADTLEWHKLLKEDQSFPVKVFPAFRPDKFLNIQMADFADQIKRLEAATGRSIESYAALKDALKERVDFFAAQGARHCDHGWDIVCFRRADESKLNEIFLKALQGKEPSFEEAAQYRTELMLYLASLYHEKNWVMQIHIGAMRSINRRMLVTQGRDCGYDSASDRPFLEDLSVFLDTLDATDSLPDTVLFSLNPYVDLMINNLAGCYPGDAHRAKVQLGPAWWMNDHIDGMQRQLRAYANSGVLSTFIGMVTDSRSFLSYPRFEYFRRIVCNFIGTEVESGRFTSDPAVSAEIVKNICYRNAYEKYFKELPSDC